MIRNSFSGSKFIKLGDRQILEKPIPQIIENGKVRVIVEKNKRLAYLWNSWNKNGKVRVIVEKNGKSVKYLKPNKSPFL